MSLLTRRNSQCSSVGSKLAAFFRCTTRMFVRASGCVRVRACSAVQCSACYLTCAHPACTPSVGACVRACVRGEPTYLLGHRFFGFRVGVARHFGLLPTARPQAALDGGGVGGVATRAAAATHLRGHVNARARSLTELAQRRLPLQAATPRADKDVLAVLLSQRGEVLAARDGRQLGEHDRLCRVPWHGELVALAGARQETDLDGLRTFGVARRDPAAGQLAAVGVAAAVVSASGMAAAAVGVVDVVVVVSTSGIADSQVDACGNVGGTSLGSSLGGGEGLASGGGGGSPGGYVGVRGLRGRGRKGRRRANDERGGRRGRRAVKLLRLPKAKISWLSPLGSHGGIRGRRWTDGGPYNVRGERTGHRAGGRTTCIVPSLVRLALPMPPMAKK